MIELSPEWQMVIAEIKKAYKKHTKYIKESIKRIKTALNTFISNLKTPYKYKYFTIDECYAVMKKYKKIKHSQLPRITRQLLNIVFA